MVLFGTWSHLISTGVGLKLRNTIGFRTPSKLERIPRDVRAILIHVEMGEMPLVSHLLRLWTLLHQLLFLVFLPTFCRWGKWNVNDLIYFHPAMS